MVSRDELLDLVAIALTMELDEIERNGLSEERVARAEFYVAWLKSELGESFD